LEPIGSLLTWTSTSWPDFSTDSMLRERPPAEAL
jgi:hypothetical protein